jgi:hypothetical protein
MSDIVRVLRVLEYIGPRKWVESTLAQNAVKGTREFGGQCSIREATIGAYPEVVGEVIPQMTAEDLGLYYARGWGLEHTWKIKPVEPPKFIRERWAVRGYGTVKYFYSYAEACGYCIDKCLPYSMIEHCK